MRQLDCNCLSLLAACLSVAIVLPHLQLASGADENALKAHILPPFRASTLIKPTLTAFVSAPQVQDGSTVTLTLVATKDSTGEKVILINTQLNVNERTELDVDVSHLTGKYVFDLAVSGTAHALSFDYEVVATGTNGTRLVDGCFIDIYHFSDDEAAYYNPQLLDMNADDWRDQMRFMSAAGIRTAILQAVFVNNMYVNADDNQTCEAYNGLAFYESALFPGRFGRFADKGDKITAILSAAEEFGMRIVIGIGNYAWFDYSNETLCWTLKVTKEIHTLYGQYRSFFGVYVTGEMAGDFWMESWPQASQYPAIVGTMETFFSTYRDYIHTEIDPTMPVMFAPNSYHWDQYAADWKRVLQHVDVLMPFGFARDPNWDTLNAILGVATATDTRVWVDMEMFAVQFPPLVPKSMEDLIAEIEKYDAVENVVGYEFTGIMDAPESRLHLGGDNATKLYVDYMEYYKSQIPSV
eukprot:Opistho-2@49864